MDFLTGPILLKEKIELTQKEERIFKLLIEVLHYFDLETKLRVAGGWVRDKLLGKQCHDIDITVDDMSGLDFGEKVNAYLLHIGEKAKEIHVIPSNPDQSKHLETAKLWLFDVEIDLVNLRSENYTENSRIPTVKFGTAEEDAYRRDLTINSLFYNIHTKSVEDLTGRGVADLKLGKIATPLPPKSTFLDDPLRVLRAIRFAGRFGFVLDEELKEAAASNEVKTAILNKVSRNRIANEVDLIICGNEPVRAIVHIHDLRLFWVVFSLPPEFEPSNSERDRLCVAFFIAAWRILQVVGFSNFDDEQRKLYLYGALFLPLRELKYTNGKDKKVPVVDYIFCNSMLKHKNRDMVIILHDASERFLSLITFITSNEVEPVEKDSERKRLHGSVSTKLRIMAGMLLREVKSCWRVSLLISILICIGDLSDIEAFPQACHELNKSLQLYRRVENTIMELGIHTVYEFDVNMRSYTEQLLTRYGLENVWEMKPLLNGKEIMSILQLKNGGKQVGEWARRLVKWQLAHPSGTVEECRDWMKRESTVHSELDFFYDQDANLDKKRNWTGT